MPKIQYLHKTRQGIPDIYAQMFGDILQNMNFSRYYRNRGKFIYGFDPNIMDIILWYVGQSDMFEYMAAQESEKTERITSVGTADI